MGESGFYRQDNRLLKKYFSFFTKFQFIEQFVNSIVGVAQGGNPYDVVRYYSINRNLLRYRGELDTCTIMIFFKKSQKKMLTNSLSRVTILKR